ncbi:DUF1149 family protein [Lactobacillus hominis]|uniref:DUF1149 family protein n=1 Tax=Lactobacillus hominis DSM 23910 = CRBIP 24.179 TaxID=1423758 RepID=I7L5Z4_9LACO|nr:DUF1149 family protein [Lactobacillus hominis]KRM84450.1 hypothetical protein FC41_GL000732 [Lactobacillus hominis DSM 23910 = CRBIP 24.179]MCT3347941.1 DUF1149 family protein [Lactobacillus hominis]CCI81712.1 Putative uncharacterized protein [Lactobacillus hominis DSM 23910 = CRBIP 24.179]
MDFKKMTPIIVRNFHYDINEEPKVKSEVNVSIRQVVQNDDQGNEMPESKEGRYFEIGVPFEVAPAPGMFTVSGLITQVVQLMGYFGEGKDLSSADYQLLSRPLVEEIETLTYEVTQITLDQPVNLNFKSNFDELLKNDDQSKDED